MAGSQLMYIARLSQWLRGLYIHSSCCLTGAELVIDVAVLFYSQMPFLSLKPPVSEVQQTIKAAITIVIRLQFSFDSTMTIAIKITIRLRFDSSKWALWQYVNEYVYCFQWRHEFIPDNILLRKWIKGLYQRRQLKDATQCWSVTFHSYYRNIHYYVIIWKRSVFVVVESKPNQNRIAVESQFW